MATTAAAERRDPTAPRRPFRAAVDLADVVDQEIWQADARDLSVSGMSVRSAMLPEVGEELACRFRLEGGEQIESRAEVVWAREGGARDGAFGVKFTALDPNVKDALLKGMPAPTPPAAATPAAATPAAVTPAVSPAPTGGVHENSKVRVVIPGMEAPLRARVRTRVQDALIVGSDLTFLKIGERVAVDGGTEKVNGSITAVDIEVDSRSGVPRLILTIDGEGNPAAAPSVPAPVSPAAPAAEAEAPRDTRVDAKDAPRAEAKPERRVEAKAATPEVTPEARPQKPTRPAQETRVLSTSDGNDLPDDDDDAFDTRTWSQRALEAAKVQGARLAAAAGPAARQATKALGGAVVSLKARLARGEGAREVTPAAEGRPALNKNGLRRQHALESDGTQAPVRNRRALALAGIGGVAALGIVVYAMTSGPRAQTPRPQVTIAPEGLTTEAPNADDPNAAATPSAATPTPTPDPLAAAPLAAAPQAAPRMVNGEGAGNSADLRSATESPSADVTAAPVRVTQRPVRAPVVAAAPRGRTSLGNPAVRAGTLVRLRMDGPITALEGVGARGAELVITVPGRRFLDRGAPIARLDNRIVSSQVWNSSTSSRLTLRFHSAAPPFSARAVGNTLQVVLGATPGVRARARR
ncbi:MAG: PilZ domain-containing protein [Polyangiales bacterium]